jgi:hypothetical protein
MPSLVLHFSDRGCAAPRKTSGGDKLARATHTPGSGSPRVDRTQSGGVSEGSEASVKPNLEDELTNEEKKEIADVLAEVSECRNQRNHTRFRATYCGEVIR